MFVCDVCRTLFFFVVRCSLFVVDHWFGLVFVGSWFSSGGSAGSCLMWCDTDASQYNCVYDAMCLNVCLNMFGILMYTRCFVCLCLVHCLKIIKSCFSIGDMLS